jgi:hypothetical protein
MRKTTAPVAQIQVTTPHAPTEWALLQRQLLKVQAEACKQFFQHYFDDRGYFKCVARWSTNDGPDDAMENVLNWPLLHALGGDDALLDMYKKAWEGHLIQYTEAKTETVAFGRDGIYYKEFPEYFDWFHIGEWLDPFFLQGLSDPYDDDYIKRMQRFAGLYMDEDPQAKNYDPENRLIRSMWNGSRGPLMRNTTRLDWAGDPIEIEGRFDPAHGERTYAEMLAHFDDYIEVVGDHPLNLGATTLALKAYMLTGAEKYRNWALEYIDAWVERTRTNDGFVPSNVGLDGTPGGACGGRWYGGVYGWAFTVIVPQTGATAHRPSFQQRAHYGFANALLLTGNLDYVRLWGDMIHKVNANAKTENGTTLYPHMYGDKDGDEGWYHYQPEPFRPGALETYYWTMDEQYAQWLPPNRWLDFLLGKDDAYPVEALKADFHNVRSRMERVRQDNATPDTRMSDDVLRLNPALTDNLIHQMLGGLPTGRVGYPLHCRLRYFDPARRRAGLPTDVAALVDSMRADEVSVTLLNLDPTRAKTVIVQGGAYAEHQIVQVQAASGAVSVDRAHFVVHLAPGSGDRLVIQMKRFANQPTCAMPWV